METINSRPAVFTAVVEYNTFSTNGQLLDTTGGKPISVIVGKGDMNPGLEMEIMQMQPGEKRIVHLAAGETWGQPDPGLIFDIRQPVENEKTGDFIRLADGREGTIISITGDIITVDTNHPWCGMDLRVEIHLIGYRRINDEDPLQTTSATAAGCCGPAGCC